MEIQSLIKPSKKQGGYFVVTRQILCMTDFLGAVYCGYPLSQRKPINKRTGAALTPKSIATSSKAKKFILTFFKPSQIYN